ncbi:MAG: amidoligase family protein [Woeseiaceae bacterium]|nr:amidoligase family protein [Woeseiaceae bacterium]
MAADWLLPERTETAEGRARRVGIEIELAGIDVGELAELSAATLGGTLERVSSVEFDIAVPDFGDFRVEVDFKLLKDLARSREERIDTDEQSLVDYAVDLLGDASTVLVPCEIVTPPLPMDEMAGPMDDLVEKLRAAGAKGTRQSVLYAFGVHLNVEPPDLEAATVLNYLKAFVCLYDWIVEAGEVDPSRQLSPYIRRYDKDYELLLADPEYTPDWPQLIDDYLEHNPTRDRALDMLPMFAEIDEPRVKAVVDDPLIKARPAFHYRLANSCIDEADWSIALPWNRWMRIERLAADADALNACLLAFAADRARVLRGLDKRWSEDVKEWLLD